MLNKNLKHCSDVIISGMKKKQKEPENHFQALFLNYA